MIKGGVRHECMHATFIPLKSILKYHVKVISSNKVNIKMQHFPKNAL